MKNMMLIILLVLPVASMAQGSSEKVMKLLTNDRYRQWKIIGTTSFLGTKSCDEGGGYFTFYQDKVIYQQCVNKNWEMKKMSFSLGEKSGELTVDIDGRAYFFKQLKSTAPACEKNANCVRLSLTATSGDEYSHDIYLTY